MKSARAQTPAAAPRWIRLWHLVHALLFVPLFLTGWHLHYGGIELWGYALSVRLHELLGIAAAALALSYPIALSLARRIGDYLPPRRGLARAVALEIAQYTAGIWRGGSPPAGGAEGARLNPVQRLLYFPLIVFVLPALSVTGLALFREESFGILPAPLERALLAAAHALFALFATLFFLLHLYMATMADWRRIAPLAIAAGVLALAPAPGLAAEIVLDRSSPALQCVGCHSGTPGSRRIVSDARTGARKDVTVELARLQVGVHGRMACRECHSRGFDRFPHRVAAERRFPACRDCHPRTEPAAAAAVDAAYDFPRLEREHAGTAHAEAFRKLRGARDCEGCHHPHYMRASASLVLPARLKAEHDGPCLSCHRPEASGALSDPLRPDLVTAHAAVPRAARHLAAVRCADCHAGRDRPLAHDLLSGRAAEGCTDCHRLDSFLLRGLWRFIPAASEPRSGFANAGLLAEHHVTAATRFLWLDRATVGALGLLAFAILAHVGLRAAARLRRGSRAEAET
ncbi:MAG: cytochrome b/b6 domain-containing protein [Geminicoccaceae bacterium]|nr:cytochrome b/b6 domain-containing protein [Geminicoccaceae bacterium]